jgi:hypothetical protein
VVCLVVQAVKIGPVGLSTEFITMNGYGMLMAAATALAVPMAMGSLYRILVLQRARAVDTTHISTQSRCVVSTEWKTFCSSSEI